MTTNFEGYSFLQKQQLTIDNRQLTPQALEIGYIYPYNVRYEYEPKTNTYIRWRGGFKEIDTLNKEQVSTENVVVMRAVSRQIGGGYNNVDILGSGDAVGYRNGAEVDGVWVKDNAEDVLRFYDENGEEISFAFGTSGIGVR